MDQRVSVESVDHQAIGDPAGFKALPGPLVTLARSVLEVRLAFLALGVGQALVARVVAGGRRVSLVLLVSGVTGVFADPGVPGGAVVRVDLGATMAAAGKFTTTVRATRTAPIAVPSTPGGPSIKTSAVIMCIAAPSTWTVAPTLATLCVVATVDASVATVDASVVADASDAVAVCVAVAASCADAVASGSVATAHGSARCTSAGRTWLVLLAPGPFAADCTSTGPACAASLPTAAVLQRSCAAVAHRLRVLAHVPAAAAARASPHTPACSLSPAPPCAWTSSSTATPS